MSRQHWIYYVRWSPRSTCFSHWAWRLLVCHTMAGPLSEEKVSSSTAVTDVPTGVRGVRRPMSGRVDPWCRAIAWGAMLAGSLLLTILSRSAGEEGYSVPFAQVLVLVGASAIASRSSRLRVLSGFLLTIAVLRLGWSVIAPMVADWGPVQGLMDDLDWGPKIFVTRLLNTTGALLMLATFIGRRVTRDDLFLRVGNLNAPVKPERILSGFAARCDGGTSGR